MLHNVELGAAQSPESVGASYAATPLVLDPQNHIFFCRCKF